MPPKASAYLGPEPSKDMLMNQMLMAFHKITLSKMCHELSHTFDDTKLGSVQDLITAISQQAFNEGWDRRDESCRKNCLPSPYLPVEEEEVDEEDGGASLLKPHPRAKLRTKSARTPRLAPRRTTKAKKPRSTRNTRRATSEPNIAADDNSDYETDNAPRKKIKRYDLGIPRRFVTKAEFSALRQHWKYTTTLYRNKTSNETEQMQLTEPEAIRWHQMKGTEYKRTKGKTAEKDEEIELNLIRFRKQIRRKIRKGVQDRREKELKGEYDGSDDDLMPQDFTQWNSTEDEEEEGQAILGDDGDEFEGENDNEGEGESVDENGNEVEREQSSEAEVNFGMPVYPARARSQSSEESEEL
ncbi:hypothetical protein ACEPPN_015117 [Leptodophora sp. 'Broadleaf-Isolate-01']